MCEGLRTHGRVIAGPRGRGRAKYPPEFKQSAWHIATFDRERVCSEPHCGYIPPAKHRRPSCGVSLGNTLEWSVLLALSLTCVVPKQCAIHARMRKLSYSFSHVFHAL